MQTIPNLGDLGFANFAGRTWRPHQAETLASVLSSKKKFLLVQAPTGFGKSPLAMSAGLLIEPKLPRQYGSDLLDPQSAILAVTKQLQRQYLDDFPHAHEVRGRGNFVCNAEPSQTAAEAICTISGPKSCDVHRAGGCSYYQHRDAALQGVQVVPNYAYFLGTANGSGAFSQQSLLVLDEGHLIDDALMSHVTSSVHRFACDMFDVRYPAQNATWNWQQWHDWAALYQDDLADEVLGLRGPATGNLATRKRFHHGSALLKTMNLLAQAPDPWVCVPSKTGWDFMPVWIGSLAESLLYRHGNKILIMSGTILNPDLFCKTVGIDPAEMEFIDVPSTFPVGAKPVEYWPAQAVKFGIDLTPTVERVTEIVRMHEGQKGLVHCVSYALAEAIRKGVPSDVSRRLISHTTVDRLEVYEAFRNGRADGVLLSPSMKEGVSLEDEHCEFICIPKMPYPYLGSPQIAARMQTSIGQSWYNWKTMCDTMQMAGRGMRHDGDHCKVYITDGNYGRVHRTMRQYLPAYWTDDLIDNTGSL